MSVRLPFSRGGCLSSGVELDEEGFVVGALVDHLVPEDARELVGHGRVGFCRSQARSHLAVLVAERAFARGKALRAHLQESAYAVLDGSRGTGEHPAAAGTVFRAEAQPGGEVGRSGKTTPVGAEFTDRAEDRQEMNAGS